MNKKYSFCRFICALLIGAMLLSSFAVSSFAEDTGAEKIYYATITNPHDHEVTMPIEIKCGFAEGEVKSADYVHIYDSMDETQTLIPHRYEGEKNAAYFEKADLGFYADNSLKFGSFWIIDTLGANETKTYALKIYDVAHEKFTKRIEVKNNNSTTTNTTVTATYGDSKAVISFGKPADSLTGAYHLVELKHSSFDNKSVATRLGYLYILDAEGNRVYPFNDSSSYTMKRSWSLGDGAVYLDYTATAQANDGTIKYTTKYRVFALLGQYHIIGRKDWEPFEQAHYLYRRHLQTKIPIAFMAEELGVSKQKAEKMIQVIKFMIENDDLNKRHWSYYEEYLKNSPLKKYRETNPDIDDTIAEAIKTDAIREAADMRKLGQIAAIGDKQTKKVMQQIADGTMDLYEGYETVEDAGKFDDVIKKLKAFKKLVNEASFDKQVMSSEETMQQARFEIGKIIKRLTAVQAKLEK